MQDVLISGGGQARNPETIKQRGFRISMNARTHCAVIMDDSRKHRMAFLVENYIEIYVKKS
jgi:hypothetical protein